MPIDMETLGEPDAIGGHPGSDEGGPMALDAVPTTADAHRVAESTAPAPRPRILVVDDSEDMRTLLREVLELQGYEVVTAGSSGRALTLMTQRRPDLVITDLMMPGMSGFSLRSIMLRRPELADVPVVILSAYWARPGETLDAVAVLAKPVNLDRLLESVRSGLGLDDQG
jgi:CheY-like chemotaxis protein